MASDHCSCNNIAQLFNSLINISLSSTSFLFVLLSLLFFLVVVTSVAVSTKNKSTRIDAQIAKIKEAYEKNVGNEEQIYHKKMNSQLYTIVFDANGGTGTMPSQNFVYGTP